MNKGYAVLGLGKFGKGIAETLADAGVDVLVVDKKEEAIHDVADLVTYAVQGDVTDQELLSSLGISNLDGVIIAIAESLEASVMATITVKEMGVPYVMVKAENNMHKTILEKLGADKVVIPERDMGVRAARNLLIGNFSDLVELSPTVSIVDMEIPTDWAGKTLRELNLRSNYRVNVVAIKEDGSVDASPDPDVVLNENQSIIISGKNKDLMKLKN